MKRDGDTIILDIAHREKDNVTLGEEGIDALRLLLDIGRAEHNKFLRRLDKEGLSEWADFLRHADKYVERVIAAAKKVIIEVDWDKWAEIEKELEAENRRLNK